MKSTKIMLAVIATFFITWCVMGLIGYLLSDASYKECMIDGAILFFLVTIGWVPSLIIGCDVDNYLD